MSGCPEESSIYMSLTTTELYAPRACALTPAQRSEIRRLTPLMKALLRAADPHGAQIGVRQHMRSARILERRGFVTIVPEGGGWHAMTLTPAGRAAVAKLSKPRWP